MDMIYYLANVQILIQMKKIVQKTLLLSLLEVCIAHNDFGKLTYG